VDNVHLINGLKNSDVFSFNEVYRKYNRKIYAFSLSFLRNKSDAEGVVQNVFLNLWRKRADLNDQYNLDSYLYKITINTIRKHFRKLSRERKALKDYGQMTEMHDEPTIKEIEYNDMLELAEISISKLPVKQKTVYELNMLEGLSYVEIAEKLGISRRTVENHLHRAKAHLKKELIHSWFL
jgi:RNA polymerase sigma-70 factor (family 1)